MHRLPAVPLAAAFLALLIRTAPAAQPPLPGPVFQKGNTPVLWLESGTVRSAWQGDDLVRLPDGDPDGPGLEWKRDPAVRGKVSLPLPGVKPEDFDAVRFQWKYEGGGTLLQVQLGDRNWYLNKRPYSPGEWHDVWLETGLDDDRIGASTNAAGEPVFTLIFGPDPLGRAEEQRWRRIRLRQIRLVRFPVRLSCDPKAVLHKSDGASFATVFPLTVSNATDAPQTVRLSFDGKALRDFTATLEADRVELAPRAARTVMLTFTIPREKADRLPPLRFEETPVYAGVEGDPLSRTTWFRGYVQWLAGGVVPPREPKRPFLQAPGALERMTPAERAQWLAKADAAMADPVVLPEKRHGYPTSYRCPEHGVELKFDLKEFRRHYCPKGDHMVEGYEHIDREAGIRRNTLNADRCRALGWAWRLTGNAAYARKAAEILLAYADRFPSWSYANPLATGYRCRVGHAILGECWWVHGINEGYDLIADAGVLSAAEKERIERDFFLPEAEEIQTHRVCFNQQCEINGASGGAALNAGHWFLAARAFTGEYGLFDQVELGFSEDGFTRENELPYHFAALHPLARQGEIYEGLGGRFFNERVKRIYDAPVAYSPVGNPGNPALYEAAYRYYKDPAFLFDDTNRPLANSSLELAGRTTLRRGTPADPRWAQVIWGGPTWRGGKDMLNVLTPLNASVSRINYGIRLPTPALSYQTLAGNVPEVDGLTQSGIRPAQAHLQGGAFPAALYRAPAALSPYPGVALTRTVAIVSNVYLIADRLIAETERRFTFAFHPGGDVTNTPGLQFEPYPAFHGEGASYNAVSNPALARGVTRWTLEYATEKKKPARMHGLLDGEGELVRGTVWSGWNPLQCPIYLARRRARAVACVQVLEPGPDYPVKALESLPLTVDGKPVKPHQGLAVRIACTNAAFLVIECTEPGLKKAGGIETTNSLWVGVLP